MSEEITIKYTYVHSFAPDKEIALKQQVFDGKESPIIKIMVNHETIGFISFRELIELIEQKSNRFAEFFEENKLQEFEK